MGFVLPFSCGSDSVAIWVLEVMPSGMPHSGPDMYPIDMRLVAASDEVD